MFLMNELEDNVNYRLCPNLNCEIFVSLTQVNNRCINFVFKREAVRYKKNCRFKMNFR